MIELNVDRVRITELLDKAKNATDDEAKNATNDESYFLCKICSRKFKSLEKLSMHKNKSKMHRENVARMHDTEMLHNESDGKSTKEQDDERSTKEGNEDVDEDTISRVLNYIVESRVTAEGRGILE